MLNLDTSAFSMLAHADQIWWEQSTCASHAKLKVRFNGIGKHQRLDDELAHLSGRTTWRGRRRVVSEGGGAAVCLFSLSKTSYPSQSLRNSKPLPFTAVRFLLPLTASPPSSSLVFCESVIIVDVFSLHSSLVVVVAGLLHCRSSRDVSIPDLCFPIADLCSRLQIYVPDCRFNVPDCRFMLHTRIEIRVVFVFAKFVSCKFVSDTNTRHDDTNCQVYLRGRPGGKPYFEGRDERKKTKKFGAGAEAASLFRFISVDIPNSG
ncbi:hypothetical protein LXL04_032807 [Taraxacum kok-saghyz]